jgi:predicted ATPase/DNA-binding SARP family transcriptional activator/DNA-binding CsgD family transcriptional regulator
MPSADERTHLGRSGAGGAVGETMSREPAYLRIGLLGGFRASVDSRSIGQGEWRLRKAAALVKVLALAPTHQMHRERLAELLWPGLGRKAAANNLYYTLHHARRTLRPEAPASLLRLVRGQLALCPGGALWVDVEAFEDAAKAARRANEPAAYRAAIDLYAGDLLPGDRYEIWAEGRREELRTLHLALLMELARLYEERGESQAATEALQRTVAVEPTHETAHTGLMRLYAEAGRRAEALAQYERLAEALSADLDEVPSTASRRLYEQIKAGKSLPGDPRAARPLPDPPPGARHNLPAARTSFVGRERELVEVKRALATTRLLTLVGAGGAGKTRLALEAARDLAPLYADGTWLVELAPFSDPALVPQTVAHALGVREQPGQPLAETLVNALRRQEALLILDNCEHLIDAVALLVQRLLDACPYLRMLATSREPLGVVGEMAWQVPPLSSPETGQARTIEELERFEAVRLFVERALHRPSAFALSPRNVAAVAEICQRLDGMPLAIELAAARVGTLAVEQISERLGNSLKLLTGGARTATPRQQTLRGALDWSYDLLDGEERKLLRRLSVFVGGWTLEAAEAVGGSEVLDPLSRLIDKSLAVAEGADGGVRYRFLEPVRQYAEEKLAAPARTAERDEARRRHATYYIRLAEAAGEGLKGLDQVSWLVRLDTELGNLRAAEEWLLETGAVEDAVRLVWALWFLWVLHGHREEVRRWTEEVLARGDALPAGVKAKVLGLRSTAYGPENPEQATPMLEESAALFREAGDRTGLAFALGGAGIAGLPLDAGRAISRLEESLGLFRELEDPWGASIALAYLGVARLHVGAAAEAARCFEDVLALSREVGNRYPGYIALYSLARMAQSGGDPKRARDLYIEGLGLAVEVNDRANTAYCLEGLAQLAALGDEPERAARLFGTSEALLERVGIPLYADANARAAYREAVDSVRIKLGGANFAAKWAEGQAMPLEKAVGYALGAEEPYREPPPTRRTEVLTSREREVARLVAQGLTNRQISSHLAISENTVANHVARILKKRNLSSRSQIAVQVTQGRMRDPG